MTRKSSSSTAPESQSRMPLLQRRSEEHTSELQSHVNLVCRLLLETATTETYTLSLHDALPIFDQCAAIGDLHHAIRAGVLSAADVRASLDQVVATKVRGRTNDEEIIVFDSTGVAIEDAAAAAKIGRAHV